MSKGKVFLDIYPAGKYGMETQARRLNREHLYLPGSFNYEEIEQQLKQLTDALGIPELTEAELTCRSCWIISIIRERLDWRNYF